MPTGKAITQRQQHRNRARRISGTFQGISESRRILTVFENHPGREAIRANRRCAARFDADGMLGGAEARRGGMEFLRPGRA